MSISISCTPARTSGVGPLYVFFDATATTSTAQTFPILDCLYLWNFGDSGAGTWTYGAVTGTSKNTAKGPVAGHIYETAGSYTWTLTVFDGTTVAQTSGSITVSDPDTTFSGTNTVCVSTSGNFTGAPAGATLTTSADFDATCQTGTGKRTLYCRGETFSASTNVIITATGPGLIGAYGTGAKPQVNMTGSVGDQPIVRFGNSSTVNQKDWRVMDLSFDGNGNAEALGLGGGFDQLTFLRITSVDNSDACIFFNSAVLNVGANPHLFEQAAIVDCDLSGPESWALFFNAKQFFVAGNRLNSSTGSHSLRISIGIWGSIVNNTMGPNGVGTAGNHVLKLHAPPYDSATDGVPINTMTEKVYIGNNDLQPGNNSTNNWTMAIDPQDDAEDERLSNIIIEENFFHPGTNTGLSISMQAVNTRVRNNLTNTTGCLSGCFIETDQRSSAAPAPSGIGLYNNTMYTNSNNLNASDTPFISITSSTATGGVTARNNLGYAPGVSGTPIMFRDQASSTLSNNSSNAQTKISPNFASGSPSTAADFQITTSSYAKGAGSNTVVYLDYFQRSRVSVTNDMGFYQFVEGLYPWLSAGASLGWLKF